MHWFHLQKFVGNVATYLYCSRTPINLDWSKSKKRHQLLLWVNWLYWQFSWIFLWQGGLQTHNDRKVFQVPWLDLYTGWAWSDVWNAQFGSVSAVCSVSRWVLPAKNTSWPWDKSAQHSRPLENRLFLYTADNSDLSIKKSKFSAFFCAKFFSKKSSSDF